MSTARRRRRSELTPPIRLLRAVLAVPYALVARLEVDGLEHLPASGPCLVVPNHLTELDPVTTALVVSRGGRVPRFLAKESLFRVPVLGAVLRGAGQVPVHRGTQDAAAALDDARRRLAEGGCVVVYAEGTLTRDPQQWPMHGYPGAARLALALDVPLVPLAHWGDQLIVGRDRDRRLRVSLRPRRTVRVRLGPPVDLDRWREAAPGAGHDADAALGEVPLSSAVAATETVMHALAQELAVLRGQPAPDRLWNDREKGRR